MKTCHCGSVNSYPTFIF